MDTPSTAQSRAAGLALAALATAALLAVGACRPAPGSAPQVSPASVGGTVITEAEIARMSVRTAWDVVRMRAPRFSAGVDATGRPTTVRIQERRSYNADETPLLIVDGVRTSDIGYLQQIPASDLHLVRILNAEAAEPLYGLQAAGGAIVVETKHGP